MILAVGAVCFGQDEPPSPDTVVREFWSAALENNPKALKRSLSLVFRNQKDFERINETVGFITANEIKIAEIARRTSFDDSAFFEVRATGKSGKKWEAQILLRKEFGRWKILHLYLRDEIGVPLIFNRRRPIIPQPLQLKKDCPKCS